MIYELLSIIRKKLSICSSWLGYGLNLHDEKSLKKFEKIFLCNQSLVLLLFHGRSNNTFTFCYKHIYLHQRHRCRQKQREFMLLNHCHLQEVIKYFSRNLYVVGKIENNHEKQTQQCNSWYHLYNKNRSSALVILKQRSMNIFIGLWLKARGTKRYIV